MVSLVSRYHDLHAAIFFIGHGLLVWIWNIDLPFDNFFKKPANTSYSVTSKFGLIYVHVITMCLEAVSALSNKVRH